MRTEHCPEPAIAFTSATGAVEVDQPVLQDDDGAARPARGSRLIVLAGIIALLGCLAADRLLSNSMDTARPVPRFTAGASVRGPASVTAPVLRAAMDENGCPLSQSCAVTVAHDGRIQAALARDLPGAVLDRLEVTRDTHARIRYRVLLSARLPSGAALQVVAQRSVAVPPRVIPWTEMALDGGTAPTFAETDLAAPGLSVHVEVSTTAPPATGLPVAKVQRFVISVWH
jgi:hypothetical protein